MVCGAAHADDEQGLDEDGYAEGVHGEAGGVDLEAEDVDDALSLVWGRAEEGCEGVCGDGIWQDGGARCSAWGGSVVEEDAVFAGELLEGDGDEGSDAADYEDLGVLEDWVVCIACVVYRVGLYVVWWSRVVC